MDIIFLKKWSIIHIKMYIYNPLYSICIQNLIKIKIIRLSIFFVYSRYIINIIDFFDSV